METTTHPHWHPGNVGSEFCLYAVAQTDAWCTDGANAACVFMTTPARSWLQSYKAKNFRAARKGPDLCPISQVYCSTSLRCHWEFFLVPKLGQSFATPDWLQKRKCLEHHTGENSALFPNPNPHIWFRFNTVKENLWTEVQGSGWSRAVLWTNKCFRQPKANGKGTIDDSAI